MKTSPKYLLRSRLKIDFDLELIIPLIFIFVGLLAAFNHSLWRDEMQGWLVASNSNNWIDLWKNNAPSGHPILWSALIYLVKDFTYSPLSMQILHWALGSTAIICFWRWNPMPILHKSLFTFGYFPFWEYYFVCRHYVLAELLIFIFLSSYSIRRKTYLPAALCIGLLTNTHAFSWSLAFASFFILAIEWFDSSEHRSIYFKNKYWKWDLLFSTLIIILLTSFAAFSLLQVREAVDLAPSSLDIRHIFRVFGRLFGGYLLVIPDSSRWLDLILASSVTIPLLVLTLAFLRHSKSALLFFLSGTGFLLLFNSFVYLGVGSRHYGYYFLLLIGSIWLALHPDKSESLFNSKKRKVLNLGLLTKSAFNYILIFCLSIHFVAGVHRSLYDFYMPYSAGKATAEYIKDKGWSDEYIFGTRDVELTTVAGYLDREIYYPELKKFGSYTQWNVRNNLERKDTLRHVKMFFKANPDIDRLLLVLSKDSAFRELKPGQIMNSGTTKIIADRSFERSWIVPERFYLYWAERDGQ